MMKIHLKNIGLMLPGFNDWPSCRAFFAQQAQATNGKIEAQQVLSKLSTQTQDQTRRLKRIPFVCQLALSAAVEALSLEATKKIQPLGIFTSSIGDGATFHDNCSSLATEQPFVSPLKFSHSLLNAVAGLWSIYGQNHNATLSFAGCEQGGAYGLLNTALKLMPHNQPYHNDVLAVSYDGQTPFPDNADVQIQQHAAIAWHAVAQLAENEPHLATLQLCLRDKSQFNQQTTWQCTDDHLNTLYKHHPTGQLLPLLESIAKQKPQTLYLSLTQQSLLEIEVLPCQP